MKEEKCQLNYILDELKNVKVAKTNANRPMESKRLDIDEVNTRLEMNSAYYLVVKEEMMKLNPGQSSETKGVRIEIESKTNQTDKIQNNPASVIKMKVTEVASGFQYSITMNLYHSNQGVHFQGGRRYGNKTSCSVAADFFEEYFKGIFTNQMKSIMTLKTILLKVDLRKHHVKTPRVTKPYKRIVKDKDIQTLFNCEECHYKTVQLTEMKRHKFKQHSIGKNTEEKPTQLLQQVQVPKMDCIHCKFDCDDNDELETHIEEHHKIKQEEIPFKGSQCNECRAKDATINEQVQKI